MAAIYSNEGNRWNILGTKGDALSSVYYFITPFHSIVYIYKNLLLMLDQQLDSVDQFARALHWNAISMTSFICSICLGNFDIFVLRQVHLFKSYTRNNLTSCNKFVKKPSTSCLRNRAACYKLSTSLELVSSTL
jgi:hypothetical protein